MIVGGTPTTYKVRESIVNPRVERKLKPHGHRKKTNVDAINGCVSRGLSGPDNRLGQSSIGDLDWKNFLTRLSAEVYLLSGRKKAW